MLTPKEFNQLFTAVIKCHHLTLTGEWSGNHMRVVDAVTLIAQFCDRPVTIKMTPTPDGEKYDISWDKEKKP